MTTTRQGRQGSNLRPAVLETAALPTELHPSASPSLPDVPNSRFERDDAAVMLDHDKLCELQLG